MSCAERKIPLGFSKMCLTRLCDLSPTSFLLLSCHSCTSQARDTLKQQSWERTWKKKRPLCNRILTICCTCRFNPLSVLNHTLSNVTIATRPEAWISSWACNAYFWNEWQNAYWLQHKQSSRTDSYNHLHLHPTHSGRIYWKWCQQQQWDWGICDKLPLGFAFGIKSSFTSL